MKTKWFIINILLLSFNVVIAQTTIKASLRMVKESKNIDRLLDRAINKGDPSRSCLVIHSYGFEDEYELTITGLLTDTAILKLDILPSADSVYFFNYKNFLILIVDHAHPQNLFRVTSISKAFRYEQNKNLSEKTIPKVNYFFASSYIFVNGRFEQLGNVESKSKKITKTLNIPIIKESKKIDSLLDRYIGVTFPKGSCLLLRPNGLKDNYNILLFAVKTDTAPYNLHTQIKEKLGYFCYKESPIFIVIKDDPFRFFSKTHFVKQFLVEFFQEDSPFPSNYFWKTWITYKNNNLVPMVISK
ncbi:hypothetical protein [Mucilaginibacter ginsenosidivorans]|uniref:Uncharacterized protein n=1 Tax=Mucilaginibacter ginsenosidivorans TaxID=398053 RepID=A0A5B8UUQ1_9SPHI|nr:hypothetical protein [Mucilaginibacter ginsenosidivorans]QEC62156.1 hypothetical protein FRZ54_06015 [Mucilaginibacter ginsenosidivorans]